MLTRHAVVVAMTAVALAGCEANQLYTAYQTNIGIHAAVNPQMTEGILMIGYRRDFAAVVPRSVDAPRESAEAGRDAMASLVCSDFAVDGIWINEYVEYLATGKAAISFANQLATKHQQGQARAFFSCFRDEGAPP